MTMPLDAPDERLARAAALREVARDDWRRMRPGRIEELSLDELHLIRDRVRERMGQRARMVTMDDVVAAATRIAAAKQKGAGR